FLLVLMRARQDPACGRILQLSLLVLAILFFFGAGEEISWGQRILGFDTPDELSAVNAQDEANLHNVEILGGKVNSDRLFQAFWLLFAVAVPVAAAASTRFRGRVGRLIPILPLWVAALLIINQLVA